MDIFPEDLGPRQCKQVLEHRLWCIGTHGAERIAAAPVSPSGHVQASPKGKPNFTPEYLIASLCVAWIVSAAFHVTFLWAFLFLIGIAVLWRRRRDTRADQMAPVQTMQQGFAEPKTGTYARLTEAEITLLQNALLQRGNDDPLVGMYLELVWAAMHLAPLTPSQAETERNAREAIRALGGAIESLPPQTLDSALDSHAKLQDVAAHLAAEAAGESDPVVAASLSRRAEALRGQAETIARVKVILRRNLALREELADQISALRTSLAAAALGGGDSGPELASLAARIRRVASEANAVTAARVEVDALLSQPHAHAGVPAATEERRQQILGLNGEML